MMKLETMEDAAICTDCLMYLCNGDVPHDDDPRHPWEGVGDNTPWFSFWHKEDGESFFSWHRCDNCERPLGGDRHEGTLIRYTTEVEQ